MDEQHDRELGTAALILHKQGQLDAASLLMAVQDMSYEYIDDWPGVVQYKAHFKVDFALLDEFTPELSEQICVALTKAQQDARHQIEALEVGPTLVEGDWRSEIRDAIAGKPVSNQAKLMPLPARHPTMDRMNFRDQGELVVYRALKRKQELLPKNDTIAIAPNAAVRILGHTWEPDFLVTYKRRCGAIEVDGKVHRQRWANDRSRDDLFEDVGLVRVERIPVEETQDAAALDARIEKFLQRLTESK